MNPVSNSLSARVCLQSRKGRNGPWINTNPYPEKMHKFRRICFFVTKNITFNFTIIAHCEANIGPISDTIFLSPFAEKNKLEKRNTIITHFKNFEAGEKFYVYIGVDVNENEFFINQKFQVTLTLKNPENGFETCLYTLVTSPTRDHKYESSAKGKLQSKISSYEIISKDIREDDFLMNTPQNNIPAHYDNETDEVVDEDFNMAMEEFSANSMNYKPINVESSLFSPVSEEQNSLLFT